MTYESKFKRKDIDELFKAILTLKDEEDCYRFLKTSVLSMKYMPLRSDCKWRNYSTKRKLTAK